MSNALAQSATKLTSSTSIDNYDYQAAVAKVAKRKVGANGITLSANSIKRESLVSGVCKDFRNTFSSLFSKRDEKGNIIEGTVSRVPEEYYDKIVEAVDEYLDKQFEIFRQQPDELVKYSVRFIHQSARHDVLKRHTIIRDEVIALTERKLGIMLFIGETKRQIAKIEEQKSVLSEKTEERLKKLEKRLLKEEETLAELQARIAQQKPAEQATKSESGTESATK